MLQLRLASRALVISGAFALCIGMLATSGLWGLGELSTIVKHTQQVGQALGNQNEADMMHDALRADVLLAREYSNEGTAVRKASEVNNDVMEHGERFISLIEENAKLPVPATLKAKIEKTAPFVRAYYQDALETARVALGQPEAFAVRYDKFQKNFKRLEGLMEELGSEFEKFQTAVSDEARGVETLAMLIFAVVIVLSLLVATGAWWFTRQTVVRPLTVLEKEMGELARGNATIDVPYLQRADEIGDMARALQVFKTNAAEVKRLADEQRASEVRTQADRQTAMNKLALDFEASVGGIVQAVAASAAQLESSAQVMSATADSTKGETKAVASSLDSASSSVQTAASAAEELSASVQEITNQVTRSVQLAGAAVDDARRTDETVQGLAQASSKIGHVVKMINDIAEQTNLLALNATIEAARAGEAGKGFAVVASEVKSLANQTARATEDIATQISASQAASGQAVEAIRAISARIGEIDQIAAAIRTAVTEQGIATREIAQSIAMAASGTADVNHAVGNVARGASDTGLAAESVKEASETLSKQAVDLRGAVEAFVRSVRTGTR